MEYHGKEDLFGGKMPKNIEDSLIAFLDMRGWSKEVKGAMTYIGTDKTLPKELRGVTGDSPMWSESDAKYLKDHSQIVPIFYQKYCGESRFGTRLDINSIEKLYSDIKSDTRQRRKKKGRKMRKEPKSRTQKYTVVQLLSIIEAGLQQETLSIRFDYVSMHLRCIQFLKQVKAGANDYLMGKHGEGYLENDSQLPYIVGYILHVAVMSQRATAMVLKSAKKSTSGVTLASKLVIGAIKSLNKCLAGGKEGSVETEKLG
jgi:hypothetical protein